MMQNHWMLLAGVLFSAWTLSAGIIPVSPVAETEVTLHRKSQKEFLTRPESERRKIFADSAGRKKLRSEGWYPLPTRLVWKVTAGEKAPFTVTVADNPEFRNAVTLKSAKQEAMIDNLKIACRYYWKVSSGKTVSGTAVFQTSPLAPRLIRVNTVPNVRDLGGRIGLNGRRVKQDLVFRSAGLNDNASPIYDRNDLPSESKAMLALEERCAALKTKDFVPVRFGKEWTVLFLKQKALSRDEFSTLARLGSIPKSLQGVPAKKLTGKEGLISFPLIADSKPAVLMQEFDSPADGWSSVSCGADWYWMLSVNGKVEADLHNGNLVSVDEHNYSLDFPVRKGKNLLVIVLGSGSAGWDFRWKNEPAAPSEKDRKASRRKITQANARHRKAIGYTPGKNRVSGAAGDYMRKVLKIRSDIDLRSDSECYGMKGSPLGPTVTWYHYSSSAYGGMASKAGKKAFSKVFRVFLDRKNYPVDFHCIAGQDRTGAVAFILNALLGVPEDQLYADWESTGFWNRNVSFNHKNLFDKLVKVFASYPGKDIREKTEAYVLSCGFTKKDIETFRSIMLE